MNRLASLMLLCCVVGLSAYLLTVRIKPVPELTDYVPAEALAVMESGNLAKTWTQWRRSVVGETLFQKDFSGFLVKSGVAQPFAEDLAALLSGVDHFARSAGFDRLFARKAVAALLPPFSGAPASTAPGKRLAVIVESPGEGEPQRFAESLWGVVRSRVVKQFHGETMVTLTFADSRTLSYCLQRGVLIAALDEEIVQRCVSQSLQRMVQARTGLQLNTPYLRLKALAGAHPDFFLYADALGLTRLWPLPTYWPEAPVGLRTLSLAFFDRVQGEVGRFGVAALTDPASLIGLIPGGPLAAPVENPSLPHVASDTDFSLWTNWFDLKKLWDMVQSKSPSEVAALLSPTAQYLEMKTGLTMDSFFNVFGNEFGVFINRQRAPHQSPRSMACVSAGVRDQARAAAALKALTAGLQAIRVVADGTEIVSVIMAGGLLQPAYALVNNQLMLADSVELIEQLLHPPGEQSPSLTREERSARGRRGNFFLFARTGALADRLLPTLTVLARETRDKSDIFSPQSRLWLQEIVLPGLNRLRNVDASRLRGYAFADEALVELEYSSAQTTSAPY
jgi:hypothetical protein